MIIVNNIHFIVMLGSDSDGSENAKPEASIEDRE
jgi:hypothetical protein